MYTPDIQGTLYLKRMAQITHDKRQLTVLNNSASAKPIEGRTCFTEHARQNVDCQRQRCPNWIEHSEGHNCVMITAQTGPHTLQKIGQIFKLTRMRICQIEKTIFEKIRNVS